MDFSRLFHRSSKQLTRVPANSKDWPDEWKTTLYKNYGTLRQLHLPLEGKDLPFFELVRNRKSDRDFTDVGLTKNELSLLLKYSCGEIGGATDGGDTRRAQPSGGARFPIEAYVLVFRPSADLSAGLYHYNVQKHTLDVLSERNFSSIDISKFFTYPWVQDASAALVLTGTFHRSQAKYGERGYRFVLLEAGHIGQNVYLAAASLGLKSAALGGTRDEPLERLLQIDGVQESVVYTLVLGK